uniref:Uncharacterized protein n=1 Tax=Chromera velia CCMP2878 TaxID=1169474 RepID=A0A0G4HCQ8_9ALVE|eukprot:Cvel_951.t1-p1 / transcript=Cvel_951.t1 / gene=Cvel_951 / organism=Chromera_velia_CCMP2878 / gene_product=hypothetical protein / transcript_product=hypothetical protein / location=Cvel_scaffold30:143327-151050(-) / protein_length=686 / sequence_SO=supercontig / SO=protein_coding / is_pseudo=false
MALYPREPLVWILTMFVFFKVQQYKPVAFSMLLGRVRFLVTRKMEVGTGKREKDTKTYLLAALMRCGHLLVDHELEGLVYRTFLEFLSLGFACVVTSVIVCMGMWSFQGAVGNSAFVETVLIGCIAALVLSLTYVYINFVKINRKDEMIWIPAALTSTFALVAFYLVAVPSGSAIEGLPVVDVRLAEALEDMRVRWLVFLEAVGEGTEKWVWIAEWQAVAVRFFAGLLAALVVLAGYNGVSKEMQLLEFALANPESMGCKRPQFVEWCQKRSPGRFFIFLACALPPVCLSLYFEDMARKPLVNAGWFDECEFCRLRWGLVAFTAALRLMMIPLLLQILLFRSAESLLSRSDQDREEEGGGGRGDPQRGPDAAAFLPVSAGYGVARLSPEMELRGQADRLKEFPEAPKPSDKYFKVVGLRAKSDGAAEKTLTQRVELARLGLAAKALEIALLPALLLVLALSEGIGAELSACSETRSFPFSFTFLLTKPAAAIGVFGKGWGGREGKPPVSPAKVPEECTWVWSADFMTLRSNVEACDAAAKAREDGVVRVSAVQTGDGGASGKHVETMRSAAGGGLVDFVRALAQGKEGAFRDVFPSLEVPEDLPECQSEKLSSGSGKSGARKAMESLPYRLKAWTEGLITEFLSLYPSEVWWESCKTALISVVACLSFFSFSATLLTRMAHSEVDQ